MEQFLATPEVQGLAPFVVALVLLPLLRYLRPGWEALAVSAGFLVLVLLVNGVTVTPLTGTRKIMLIGLAAAPAGLLLQAMLRGRVLSAATAVLGVVAGLWVFWIVLAREEGLALALAAGGAVIYIAWLCASMDALAARPLRAGAAGAALALGTGVSVLLGASALLGQLGMALGAAAGAFLLLAAFMRGLQAGTAFTLVLGLTSALIGYAGVMFARLPWFVLLPLAIVPLVAQVPVAQRLPRWLRAGVMFACAAAPSAVAALGTALTQQDSGGY